VKFIWMVLLCGMAMAQAPGDAPEALPAPAATAQLAGRAVQLMESTAAAVPGLSQASDILRRNAGQTADVLKRNPADAVLTYRFLNEARAFLAMSDAFPRPTPFPQTASEQLVELRDAVSRWQLLFEARLAAGARDAAAAAADPAKRKRYAEANVKLPPPASQRVVFLGDSITDFWRLNEYFPGRDFVNRGISGQTTAQILGRFLPDVAALRPAAVLILAGTNDLAHGITVQEIEDNLTAMGDLAKQHSIKPVFASLLPVSDYHKDADPSWERTIARPPRLIQQVNAWLQDYCRRENFGYVNYYAALVDSSGQIPADSSDDGLHPNARGYRLMSPIALQEIERTLGAAQAPAQKKRTGLFGTQR
jgi:lysophospholipase L1-like esterase